MSPLTNNSIIRKTTPYVSVVSDDNIISAANITIKNNTENLSSSKKQTQAFDFVGIAG